MAIVEYLHSVRQVGCAQGQIYIENIAHTIKAIPGIISINLPGADSNWSMETLIRRLIIT